MNDPVISLHALSAELGISVTSLRRWAAAGYIPRVGKGTTTLLAALRGIVQAVAAEAADTVPYRVNDPEAVTGTVLLSEALPALERVAQAFDAAIVEAAGAASQASLRQPLTPAGTAAARQAEAVRTSLLAARRRAAALPQGCLALAQEWERRA